ncbi:MAG: T9SS type A sorting domain-containing protein [Bacteroidia bacterium]|jgi:hypothetical protein|nr:T9SS type A sorting domain-containing protein [Bacteroidia bacterium]
MKKIYYLITTLLLLSAMNIHAQVTVSASAGTLSGSYSTLKDAFDNINNGSHQGVVDIVISANTIESASARLERSGFNSASYTKVTIKPSATATVSGNIVGALVHLRGAENVTIDGRVGTNPGNELTFENTNSTLNTAVIQLSTKGAGLGCVFDTVMFCNIKAGGHTGGVNTFGIFMADSVISATGSGINNNYNAFVGNNIMKCRFGIYARGNAVAVANYSKSIYIANNTIGSDADSLNVSFNGINCQNMDSMRIEGNQIINMFETNFTAIVRGMDLGANIINTTINGNYINNIRNTTITLFRSGQGIFLATTAASNTVISNNVITNLNGHGSNTITNNTWGILLNAGGGVRILFNTIALTGSAANTGSSDLSGCLLLNSAASTTVQIRGNIFFNTRQPGNNATGTSYCVRSATANTNITIDTNIYYVVPANARFVVGFIGGLNRNTFADWQVGTAQDLGSLGTNPIIATTSGGRGKIGTTTPALLVGPIATGITTDITGALRGPNPSIGAYEGTSAYIDFQPTNIYTLGKVAIPYANPHTVRARIFNLGNENVGYKAYIQISGVNSFLDSVSLPPLAPGGSATVDLPAFNYSNLGVDTVIVSVETDSNNTNNRLSLIQVITSNTYGYAEPFRPSDGGVGFTGGTGDFVAKFPYTGSNSINQIGVNFNTGGQTLSIGIWDTAVTGVPGTNLWTSAPFTSVTGLNTIIVNPPVPISGSFFVGVRQTGTTNAAFAYQTESPIRPATFYFASPTGSTTWNDFAPNNPFRFMIEPRLQEANDIGATGVILPCINVIQGTPAFNPEVNVFNYGINAQSSFIVQSSITGPVSSTSSDTFTTTLNSGATLAFNLSTLFNPTTVGTYTMKVWTVMAADAQIGNDTFTYQFTVSDINTYTNAGNQLNISSGQYGFVENKPSIDITTDKLTLEAWVNSAATGTRVILNKDSSAAVPEYSLYLKAGDTLVFKMLTTNGIDSVVSNRAVPFLTYAHVAAVYDGAEARLYINGELAGVKAITGTIMGNTRPLYVGAGTNGASNYFIGSLDEIKIWDTVRSQHEIRSQMHTRLANFANSHLKVYWRADEIVSTSMADASGNCNAAALISNPTFTTSSIPLGLPVVSNQTVNASGVFNFAGTNIALNVFNQVDSNQVYIHRFSGLPGGTLPSVSPGTVTNTNINNWVVYRYGSGTMDSAEATFSISGVSLAAVQTDLRMFTRANGANGGWIEADTANAVDPALQTVTMRLIAGDFTKQITLGATGMVLPVSLLYFTGKNTRTDVTLNWATANELDNAGFYVERSTNGRNFTQVGFVQGKGTTNSNTRYAWVDQNAFVTAGARKLYYRLVQRDFSGAQTTTPIVTVLSEVAITNKATAYPNPFSNEVSIAVDSERDGILEVTVLDVTGRIVYQASESVKAGLSNIETTGLQKLGNGMYIVRTKLNGITETQKLLKE